MQYTVRDAGYTATDAALCMVQNKTQCQWLSITNGDNIYGSKVFDRVLNVEPLQGTKKLPDLFLCPMDGRYFAESGKLSSSLCIWLKGDKDIKDELYYLAAYCIIFIFFKNEFTEYHAKRLLLDNTTDRFDLRCDHLEEEILRSPYGYARTTNPVVGQVDLAAYFILRESFAVLGANFSKLRFRFVLKDFYWI